MCHATSCYAITCTTRILRILNETLMAEAQKKFGTYADVAALKAPIYIYIYIYIHTYTYVYIYIYMYTHTHV